MTQRRVVIFLAVLTFVFLFNAAYAETFEAFGRSIDTDAETLDLSDLRRADARELHAALSRMPNIKQVLMKMVIELINYFQSVQAKNIDYSL